MMKSSKTLLNMLSALALSFSSALMAMDIRTESDNLSPQSSSIDGAAPVDEGAGAAPGRNKREARGRSSGGGYRGSSYRGSSYRGSSYRGSSYGGGGYKKGSYTYKHWKGNTFRALTKVTNYIKSARSGVRVNLTKIKNGYSMTTPKKIQVSVNPVGKSFRGSQPISKIDSKVRFHGKESDFLYFTLRAGVAYSLFRLVFMKNEADPSQLYLGYYEEEENRVIDSDNSCSTAAPLLVKDVIVRLNGTDSAVNSTTVPAYSAQPSGFSLTNTTGLPDVSSKKSELKPFRLLLVLDQEQEYSIEVAWKSVETLSSVSMPAPGSMSYTTIAPSSTFSTLPTTSTPSVDMVQTTPETAPAIPEDVGTQIIIRNKDGEISTTLNLDLALRHYSFSDANGPLLEYEVDGSKVNLLTKVNTENHYDYLETGKTDSDSKKLKNLGIALGSTFGGIGLIFVVAVSATCIKNKRSTPEAVSL